METMLTMHSPFLKSHILELRLPNVISKLKSILKLEQYAYQPLVYQIFVDVNSYLPTTTSFKLNLYFIKNKDFKACLT